MTFSRMTASIPVFCMMPPKLKAAKATSWVSIMLISPPREMSLSTTATPVWAG